MNLAKKCKNCGGFFPAKPLKLKFYCDKEPCQKKSEYFLTMIKQERYISLRNFDLYDLDRPIKANNRIIDYERVCRICGSPLKNKDGSYSHFKKYCHTTRYCSGAYLYELANWNLTSKKYISLVRRKHLKEINEFIKKHKILQEHFNSRYFVICEECGRVCFDSESYPFWLKAEGRKKVFALSIPSINIHHIQPVHTLTWDNIYLIWDKRNLKALCSNCHHHQNHYLKTKTNLNFMKITEFME